MPRGLLAAGTVVAVLVGGPALLLALGAGPPRRLPTGDEIAALLTTPDRDGQVLLAALAVTGWVAWAVLAGCVLLELVAQVAGRRTPAVPGFGGAQRLAGVLVAAALAGLTAPAVTPASAAYVEAPAVAEPAGPAAESPGTAEAPGTAEPDESSRVLVHEVARGDWMWHISGR